MWPYLFGAAAAAGLAIGRNYAKTKENERIQAEKDKEATLKVIALRPIIKLISQKCWEKSISNGLLPELDSNTAWELYKYELLPKVCDPDLNKTHIRIAVTKEICRVVKEIDMKYDAEQRSPLVKRSVEHFKLKLDSIPKEISILIESACEKLGAPYTPESHQSVFQELAARPEALSYSYGSSLQQTRNDQILISRIAKETSYAIHADGRKLTDQLRQFLTDHYHANSGVYESAIIRANRQEVGKITERDEAVLLLLESDELWQDLLDSCVGWRKYGKDGILGRITWDKILQEKILSELGEALDRDSTLHQDSAIKQFLEKYLISLSKSYAWNKHDGKPNPEQILLCHIKDLLAKEDYVDSLSHTCAIRLEWDSSIKNALSYKLKDLIISKYSIAFAEEEQLSHTLSGTDYEKHCQKILSEMGWAVKYTKGSNDQGVDLLARRGEVTLCIQCKRHKGNVGNDAVQAVYAGKAFYSASHACVVTTSSYTKAAKELANRTGIILLKTKDLYTIHKKICPQ